jgi:tripartite-type tricarboxylate transporter receptor subunit TctC
MRVIFISAMLGAGIATGPVAQAQTWPAKPVRVVVPFGPGGGTDVQGRLLGKKFYETMGQTFVVDNRAGAGGMIGAELVAKAPPDGYTLLFTTASLAVNTSLYKKSGFDPVKELQPVSWISSVPLVLVVHPSVPAKSVRELVGLAKRKTGQLNVGSNGSGTTSHLSIEMLRQFAGVNAVHIPYKGGGPAMTALVGGEVDFAFAVALTAMPMIKGKRVRALAVTTFRKSSSFPDLPTMDSIYPGFESDNWYGMFFPAGTPRDMVVKLNGEILKALKAPDVRDFIVKEGGDPVGSSPEQLATYLKREVDKYAKVIKAGNIQPE